MPHMLKPHCDIDSLLFAVAQLYDKDRECECFMCTLSI